MSWRNDVVKDYLTFSKRERNGIFTILFLCLFCWVLARILPVRQKHFDKKAFQEELAHLTILIDSSRSSSAYQSDNIVDYHRPKIYYSNDVEGELFYFDPNTLSQSGWKKLGVKDRTINTILKYVQKGYRFYHPEDVRKIYGLSKITADRLIPFIRIAKKEVAKNTKADNNIKKTSILEAGLTSLTKTSTININVADTAAFISLPGIGNKLAARIVNFRQKLGGFNSVNQIAETYGLHDSTFQKIKGRLACDNPTIKRININTAEANELKLHPYINWNIAQAIVNYRKQHGAYKTLEELRKIEIITDDLFEKIVPYFFL